MKDYIIDCFDENIQKEIRSLNEKLKRLSPENFKYLSSAALNLNGKIDKTNYMFTGLSMINSVDAYKLNHMLTSARANVMEFAARSVVSVDLNDGGVATLKDYMIDRGKSGELTQIVMKVPDGFSGFNSFVIFDPPAEAEQESGGDKKKIWYYRNDTEIKFLIQNRWVYEIHALFWR